VSLARRWLLRRLSLYPPFLGAGIRVRRIATAPLAFEVELALRWWNRNAVGTQFGGSLYAMADPFHMLILIDALGDGFTVWDKAAAIRFLRPGRGPVRARFAIAPERIAEIRDEALRAGRAQPVFRVEIVDAGGAVVAEVEKTISVRRRPAVAS
jgi:acyl-coenzyme A thioesterase PaaI-like protein